MRTKRGTWGARGRVGFGVRRIGSWVPNLLQLAFRVSGLGFRATITSFKFPGQQVLYWIPS